MNRQEAIAKFAADKPMLESAWGIHLHPSTKMYVPDPWRHDLRLAMDALPTTVTDPNSAIPALLTTVIDPEVIRVIMAPLAMAEIVGERKKGNWLTQTEMFPVVEMTGEVSTYGDFNNNGRAGINMNWPQFQSYLFQTLVSYGEQELERAGLAQINYVSELDVSAAYQLNQFANQAYAFGIVGLQNYGLLNFPYLTPYLTPAIKAAGGTTWFTAGGQPNATANEVYNDIVALWNQVIVQTNGAVDMKSKATLAMSPQSELALQFANTFGVFVSDLFKKGFPNMEIKTAPQYGTQNATNPQGYSTAGNAVQLIIDNVQGQKVAYCAFNEKLRAHKIIPELSAWKQKKTSGVWGAIVRMPVGISGMIGV
jgi:hypothetical protein